MTKLTVEEVESQLLELIKEVDIDDLAATYGMLFGCQCWPIVDPVTGRWTFEVEEEQ